LGGLKGPWLPPFGRADAAPVDELTSRALMEEVLVVLTGEFGRTPRAGTPIKGGAGATPTGRDHWPGVFSLLAFGAGVASGQVLGASDRTASDPATTAYTPADLAANILQALGVDTAGEIPDATGR